MVVPPVSDPGTHYTEGPKSKGKRTGVSAQSIADNIALACNMVASMNRPWWQKTSAECMPLGEPLETAFKGLDKELQERLQGASLPIAIMVGAFIVFAGPINYEINLSKSEAAARASRVGSGAQGTGVGSPGPQAGAYGGTGGGPGSNGNVPPGVFGGRLPVSDTRNGPA